MKLLFNAGDSYTDTTGPWCPESKLQYWHTIGLALGCATMINESQQQRSNTAIIRSVISHCLGNPTLDTVYLINLTNLFRKDIVAGHSHKLEDILNKQAISQLDFEVLECELYIQLIGLIEFLRTHRKQFYIVNNSTDYSDQPLPMRDLYVSYIKQCPEVLNWFAGSKYSFFEQNGHKPVDYEQYGWHGHLDPKGHEMYAKYLLDLIN